MDYTNSADYAVHAATGNRMHDDQSPITTIWSATDGNTVLWSLMEILKAANMTGIPFNPDNPTSYQQLLAALRKMFGNPFPSDPQDGWVLAWQGDTATGKLVWKKDSGGGYEVGDMKMWPSMTLPKDGKWMIMNGDLLPVADFSELFSVIGDTFGKNEDGSEFALPDDRALVWRGLDLGRGYDIDRVLGSEQMDMVGAVTGSVIGNAIGLPSQLTGLVGGSSLRHVTAASLFTRTGAETTMKNRAYLPIIKVSP